MAVKLALIVNPKFQEVLVKLSRSKIPLKTAFKLKGIVKTTQIEFEKYEDCRKQALEKYGSKDDNGELIVENGNIKLEGEALQSFAKDLSELANMEIQMDSIFIDELGDKCELTTEELINLGDLIQD